jgi:undecaprenyl-diphosphatase
MIEIFILSVVQGITEFIPVSSSSHLIIITEYFNFNSQNLTVDLSLHVGSFLAVVTYFKNDLLNFVSNRKLFLKIILASIPTMVVGFVLVKYDLISQLRDPQVIGWTTLVFGILLFISDKSKTTNVIKNDLSYKSALYIGIFQILSLIPGVSRSGITISASRFLKFKRVESAKISFLLSIPTLAAVTFFTIITLYKSNDLNFSFLNLFAILLSFIVSYITIKYFLKYVNNFNLNIFVVYRIAIGATILYFV